MNEHLEAIERTLWAIFVAILFQTCASNMGPGSLSGIQRAIEMKDCK